MTAPFKVQPGDLVQVETPAMSGIPHGFYVVSSVEADAIKVTPMNGSGHAPREIQPDDVLKVFHADFYRSARVPQPKPEAPAPATRPTEPLVIVSVANPKKTSIQMTRLRDRANGWPQESVLMMTFKTKHTNRKSGGASQLAVACPKDKVADLLRSDETDSMYVVTEEEAGAVPEGVTTITEEFGGR